MKKYLSLLCIGLFSFAVFSPAFAQNINSSATANMTATTQALIQVLTQLLQQLQLQLQTLLAQQGNGGTTNSDLKLNSPTFAADGSVHVNAAVNSVNSVQTNALTSVTLFVQCPNNVHAYWGESGIELCNSNVNMDQIGEWGTYQKVFKFNNYSGSDQTVRFTATSKPNTATKSVSILIPSNTSTQTQPFIVTFPATGSNLQAGQTYNITWTSSDTNVNSYAVYLIGGKSGPNGSTFIGTAYPRGAGNVGIFSWTIPADLTIASNYQIQFSGAGVTGGSSGIFSIYSSIQNQSIPVITSINGKAGSFTAGSGNTAYGQNLTDIQSVKLSPVGGEQGTYVNWSNANGSSITISLPSSPELPTGSYNLFIINKGGTSVPFKVSVASSVIQYETIYTSNIEGVGARAEPASSFYPGEQVTIVGSNFPQNPTIMIGSTSVIGQTNSSGMNITFTAPSMMAGNYDLSISTRGDSNTVRVTVLSR
ncbi:MAG: Ser-Thr-rich GPI-anchored membrane family protein [bacterium]